MQERINETVTLNIVLACAHFDICYIYSKKKPPNERKNAKKQFCHVQFILRLYQNLNSGLNHDQSHYVLEDLWNLSGPEIQHLGWQSLTRRAEKEGAESVFVLYVMNEK